MLRLFVILFTTTWNVGVDGADELHESGSTNRANAPPVCVANGLDIKPIPNSYSNSSFGYYEVGGRRYLDLQCEAQYPIDFEFDGLPPKGHELRVNFFSTFEVGNGTIIFRALINFLELEGSNPSGLYSVFSVENPTLRYSIYVFETNDKGSRLFRASNTRQRFAIQDGDIVTIGCKSTVFDVQVLLFRQLMNAKVITIPIKFGPSKFITYDPSRGFTWNTTGENQETIREFNYTCKCDKCNNSLGFILPPLVPDQGMDSTTSKDRTATWLKMDIKVVNNETQITCRDTYSQDFYVANIIVENPRQLGLTLGCLAKSQRRDCASKLTAGLEDSNQATVRSAHSHGLAYCFDPNLGGMKISREYFRGLDDIIYYDWNVALKSSNALIKLECQNHERIYTGQNYTFTCAFQPYILVSPKFFQLHYKDGSNEMKLYSPGYTDRKNQRTGEVTFILFSNVSRVSCSALPWNSSVFINSSIAFSLRDKKVPNFEDKEERTKFVLKSTNTQLKCMASGDELPKMSWEKDGLPLNETNLDMKYEPGSSVIVFPIIRPEHKGIYNCIAANSEGVATKSYYITVEDPNEINYGLVAGLPIGAVVTIILTVICVYIIIRHFYNKNLYMTQEEIDEFKRGCEGSNNVQDGGDQMKIMENIQYGPYDNKYEIPTSQFQLDRSSILGSGQFGIVYKGLYNHEPIAIKTIKPNTEKTYLKALLTELKVMIYINGHENIVNLIGANTEALNKGTVYAFVEFCPLGSLESFLRKGQKKFVNQFSSSGEFYFNMGSYANVKTDADALYTKDLILWSMQISSGMEYLANKKVIHGDLATRNVLLLNRETVKITDFGLAKKLYDYAVYEKKNLVPLPWRWMAIESLKNLRFSTKSDVWAFGVTLWEIFTLGDVPFPGLSWSPEFVKQLQNNLRMTQPENANAEIYDMMCHCWEIDPNDRPSFSDLIKFFSKYLSQDSDE